jgi:hypothetical protein
MTPLVDNSKKRAALLASSKIVRTHRRIAPESTRNDGKDTDSCG